jgi:hypothetical protein
MIQTRAAGPGPRTAALPWAAPILALAIALVVAACGGATPSGTSSVEQRPSNPPPSVDGSGGPDATPPHWPGTTVLAVIALGAADGEIEKAGVDLQNAANSEDLKAMWGAADGLARLIDGLMPNLDRLTSYGLTKPVGELYGTAFPEIAAGAKQLRDAITAHDAAGIATGYQQIAKGITDYGPIREQIAALVEQAIVQQRLLLN